MAIGCDRYVIAFTMEPARMYRCTLSVCSDLHRILTGAGARVVFAPIKTAMKKEQVRERERYTRKMRFSPPFT